MRLEYFQLVDRILALSLTDRRIRAEAAVPTTGSLFEGHFPGHPLLPGVLLVETMAQTAGWLAVAAAGFSRMAVLAQIKDAKLRDFVPPGRLLTIEAELAHEGSGFVVARARVTAEGKRTADAELTLRLLPFPNAELAEHMREAAQRIGLPMGSPVDG